MTPHAHYIWNVIRCLFADLDLKIQRPTNIALISIYSLSVLSKTIMLVKAIPSLYLGKENKKNMVLELAIAMCGSTLTKQKWEVMNKSGYLINNLANTRILLILFLCSILQLWTSLSVTLYPKSVHGMHYLLYLGWVSSKGLKNMVTKLATKPHNGTHRFNGEVCRSFQRAACQRLSISDHLASIIT